MCLDAEKRNIYVFGGQTLFLHLSGEDRPTAGSFFSLKLVPSGSNIYKDNKPLMSSLLVFNRVYILEYS